MASLQLCSLYNRQTAQSYEQAFNLLTEVKLNSSECSIDLNKKNQALTDLKFCIEYLDNLIANHNDQHQFWFTRGQARQLLIELTTPCENYEALIKSSIEDLEKAVELDPTNANYLSTLVLQKLGYAEDLTTGNLLISEDSGSLSDQWNSVLKCSRALIELKQIDQHQRQVALKALCISLFRLGQQEECTTYISEWIKACGSGVEAVEALHFKGKFDFEFNNSEAALKDWDAALSLKPDYIPSLISKAHAYRELRLPKEAISIWKTIIDLQPNDPDFRYRSAADYELYGDRSAAIMALEKALELNPKHLFALNDLAFHYINDQRWKEALPLLQEVLMQGPEDDIPWINIANVLFHLKEYDQALRSIDQSMSVHRVGNRPPSAEEHLIKAAILRAISSSEHEHDIIKCFVNALRASSKIERAQAHFEYADYLCSKDSTEQATKQIESALRLQPNFKLEQFNLTQIDLDPKTIVLFNSIKKS